jgi:hypothetical protein
MVVGVDAAAAPLVVFAIIGFELRRITDSTEMS